MFSVRFRALLNTMLVVVGALLIGQVIHVTVVTGEARLLTVAQIGQAAVGVGLVVLGRLIHNPVDEAERRYRQREAEASADGDPQAEFDPDLSPIGSDLDDGEADR